MDKHLTKSEQMLLDPDIKRWYDRSGEVYQGLAKGIINKDDLFSLGDVSLGNVKGRTSDKDITFFKSTGVACEGLITAILVYERFKK